MLFFLCTKQTRTQGKGACKENAKSRSGVGHCVCVVRCCSALHCSDFIQEQNQYSSSRNPPKITTALIYHVQNYFVLVFCNSRRCKCHRVSKNNAIVKCSMAEPEKRIWHRKTNPQQIKITGEKKKRKRQTNKSSFLQQGTRPVLALLSVKR